VTPFPARDFEVARERYDLIGPLEDGGLGGFIDAFDVEGNPIFGGRLPLGAHALDVLLQIFLCDMSVDITDMVKEGHARHIAETSDGVAHCSEEDGWDRGYEEIAEDGIRIMPNDEIYEERLVLVVVLRNFGVLGLVLVGWEGWRGGGDLERNAADAALFVVGGVDGEGQVAMDSVSLRQ
jgi:hypothetical protein